VAARSNTVLHASRSPEVAASADSCEPQDRAGVPVPVVDVAEQPTVVPAHAPAVEPAAALQVLVFVVKGGRFAVPIESVTEVQRIVAFRGEGCGEAMLGMIDLRGRATAALDASVLLGLGRADLTTDSQMVILGGDFPSATGESVAAEPVALLVDEVDDVVTLDGDALGALPSRHALAGRALGVFRRGDALVTVLDATRVLSDASLPPGVGGSPRSGAVGGSSKTVAASGSPRRGAARRGKGSR
jgi:chemotaxis signal transduction protein